MVAGLLERGLDLRDADLFVGTSAGSVVGTLLAAGTDLDDVIASQRETHDIESIGAEVDIERMVVGIMSVVAGATSQEELRQRIGQMAVAADTVPEAERIAIIESRLPVKEWPEKRLLITGVDVGSGEPVVWDRGSGAPLVLAIAASCAVPGVWPPVTIDGRRYMDGGVRSLCNADLAVGCERVVVLAPYPAGINGTVYDEVAQYPPETEAVVVAADDASLEAIGPNPLDVSRRELALEAGLTQAAAAADDVARIWTA